MSDSDKFEITIEILYWKHLKHKFFFLFFFLRSTEIGIRQETL